MLRDQQATTRPSPGSCGSAREPTTRRTTARRIRRQVQGMFDDGYEAYREWVLARMIEKGVVPEAPRLHRQSATRGSCPTR